MKNKVICFLDDEGRVILEKKLTAIPLREEGIISKSIEYFDDPEPCMIHRSAVMKRIYMEIDDCLNNMLDKGEGLLGWSQVPDPLKQLVDIKEEVRYIKVKTYKG